MKHPNFTILTNLVSPESETWVGTSWEFFDEEENAKKCYDRQIVAGNCPIMRPFSFYIDWEHLAAVHKVKEF